MSEGMNVVLGPALALLPILAWELWLKPLRVKRNVALSLLSEVDINLHWVLSLAQYREAHAGALLARPMARRMVVESRAHELGELPFELVDRILRFYANIDAVMALNSSARDDRQRQAHTVDDAQKARLDDDIRRAQASLTHFIPWTIESGDVLRTQLYRLACDLSVAEQLPPLRSMSELRAAAWVTYATPEVARD